MILSYKYRVRPNRAQSAVLDTMLDAFRDLYNAGLQQRIEAYRRQGKVLCFAGQCAELKAVRSADERLAGFSFCAEQQVLRRLDKAFAGYFRRLKAGQKPGFPRFRSRSRWHAADFRVGNGLTLRKSRRLAIIGVPGEIKVRWHRPLPAKPKVAVLTRQAGKWYVVFAVEMPEAEPRADFAPVGIDLGLSSLVALSTGETIPTPQWTKSAAKGLRRRQRALARCRPRSNTRAKRKAALARYQAKVAARRRDHLHKLSRDLTRRFSHIAMEDLNIKGLASGMLAKSVRNAAWGTLAGMIAYKAAKAGGQVALVDPRGTSRTCPECGTVAAKTLAEREHRCECGCVLDRDVAAAREILRRAGWIGHGPCPGAPSERVAA